MKIIYRLVIILLLFPLLYQKISFAEPTYRYDENGRLVFVVSEDGTIISYSYDKDNKRVRNDNSADENVDYSNEGNAVSRPQK